MNAIAIEYQNTSDLVPYARNSRTHSDEQVAQIANSIREFGFTNPVLIDNQNGIIAGHGRILGASKLGMEQVPCIRLGHLTDAQKRAYVIADNQLALNAGWNDEMLKLEIADLQDLDFDLELLGFSDDELADFLNEEDEENTSGLTDQDNVPPAPVDPVTKTGDVWIMGSHRLMCGDSTDSNNVSSLMVGAKADLCFTSPPYGNQREYTTGGIADWDKLMKGVFSCLPMSEEGQVFVNLGMIHKNNEWVPYWDGWIEWMRSCGWRRFGLYVWDQGPGLPGDFSGRLAPSHEFIFHFNKKSLKPKKTKECKHAGEKNHVSGLMSADGKVNSYSDFGKTVQDFKIPDSVIRISRHKARGIECVHPAVFSVNLVVEFAMAWHGVMYEPFSGSGTTIIAAEQTGRKCYAMELAPQYVDVAVTRWQNFTGKKAILESTGETFDEVASGVR